MSQLQILKWLTEFFSSVLFPENRSQIYFHESNVNFKLCLVLHFIQQMLYLAHLIQQDFFVVIAGCILAWAKKKKNLDLGFVLHRAVLYRYQDPPKKISNLQTHKRQSAGHFNFGGFYNVKTAEIGAKMLKINKMAKNHFSR